MSQERTEAGESVELCLQESETNIPDETMDRSLQPFGLSRLSSDVLPYLTNSTPPLASQYRNKRLSTTWPRGPSCRQAALNKQSCRHSEKKSNGQIFRQRYPATSNSDGHFITSGPHSHCFVVPHTLMTEPSTDSGSEGGTSVLMYIASVTAVFVVVAIAVVVGVLCCKCGAGEKYGIFFKIILH